MRSQRYWSGLRRWWYLILLAMLGCALGGYGFGAFAPPTYRASVRILITQTYIPGVENAAPDLFNQQVRSFSALLYSDPVLEEALRRAATPVTIEELRTQMRFDVVKETQLGELSVDGANPADVAMIANQLAEVTIAVSSAIQSDASRDVHAQLEQQLADARQPLDDAAQRLDLLMADPSQADVRATEILLLQNELALYQRRYSRLLTNRQNLMLSEAQTTATITVVEWADVRAWPLVPLKWSLALAGTGLGLLLSGGLAVVFDRLDDRVRDAEGVRRSVGLTPLARLGPRRRRRGARRVALPNEGGESFAEGLRVLRANLDFVAPALPRVIVVTSAVPSEGKSTVAADLALAEARSGRRVVLIDADFRCPRLHHRFNLDNAQGLSTYLSSRRQLTLPLQQGPYGVEVLVSGPSPANPVELLGSPWMRVVLDYLRGRADVIILDSVSVLSVVDTLLIQQYVTGTLLVVDTRRAHGGEVARAMQSLEHAGGRLLGIVLNDNVGVRGRKHAR